MLKNDKDSYGTLSKLLHWLIALMILAAGESTEGPGPLVSAIAGSGGTFSIPVTVVPTTLTDQDIDDLV